MQMPPKKKPQDQAMPQAPAGPPPAAPMMPPPGMPRPGQGMDPMMAMLAGMPMMGDQGMMPPPPPPPGPIMGGPGLAAGGMPPSADPGFDPAMGGSDLLKALGMQADPYAGDPDGATDLNVGGVDPRMGMEQLLTILALAQAGVGPEGSMAPGGSGVPMPPQRGGMF